MSDANGREGRAVEPRDDARDLQLVVKSNDGTERTYPLGDRTVLIGRGTTSDVVLPGADNGASRRHAEIRYDAGRYVIVDLESQNGTWVNGERLNRSVVVAGTEIAIGTYRLRVDYGAPPVADVPLSKPVPPRAAVAAAGAGRSAPSWTTVVVAVTVAVAAVAFAVWRTYVASHPARPAAVVPVAAPAPVSSAPPTPVEAPADRPPAAPSDVTSPESAGKSAAAAAPAVPPKSTALATPSPNREAALTAFQAGEHLDAAGDWVGALKKFDEARQLDPTVPDLDRATKQVTDKVRQAGYDALQRAVDDERKGNVADAVKEYDRAVQWLPDGDRRREMARTRLAQLKEGVK
jgi:predicted component of type VI protein secretion system